MKFRPKTTTSERELCVALAATGRAVSLNELSTWRKDGLLPPMASAGLGAGKGRSYYWREENILAQAQAVCDVMRRHGRPDQALITLFLSGFAVPLAQLRRAWLHRAKLRRPPGIRLVPKSRDTGPPLDLGAGNLLLQAALLIGGAVDLDDAPPCLAVISLLNRGLSKLGLARHGVNDSGLAERLWHMLNVIGSVLDTSDLVREASDDELCAAQRHLGVAKAFLRDCGDIPESIAETLSAQLFLFFLTLLRSGQARTLSRMLTYVDGANWQEPVTQTRSLSLTA